MTENDSAWFLNLMSESQSPAVSSTIISTELLCGLLRKERENCLRAEAAEVLFRRFQRNCVEGQVNLGPYDEMVCRQIERLARFAYSRPKPILIRSLDLIHLASLQ